MSRRGQAASVGITQREIDDELRIGTANRSGVRSRCAEDQSAIEIECNIIWRPETAIGVELTGGVGLRDDVILRAATDPVRAGVVNTAADFIARGASLFQKVHLARNLIGHPKCRPGSRPGRLPTIDFIITIGSFVDLTTMHRSGNIGSANT